MYPSEVLPSGFESKKLDMFLLKTYQKKQFIKLYAINFFFFKKKILNKKCMYFKKTKNELLP